MAGKREKPEDIVLKLRQVEVFAGTRPVCFGSCAADWRDCSDLLSFTPYARLKS
jgi:hypothetical protein